LALTAPITHAIRADAGTKQLADEPPQPDVDAATFARDQRSMASVEARKLALVDLHAKAMASGDWRAFDGAANALNRSLGRATVDIVHHPAAGGAQTAAASNYAVLGVVQHPQQYWNWCGPATGLSLFEYENSVLQLGRPTRTQSLLAAQMGTGAGRNDGSGVGTSISGFTAGLNAALGGSYLIYNTSLSNGNARNSAWFSNVVTGNIDASWASGIDATDSSA
jgi:hypothetical protein